jgi:predicted RNA-binding Zn ribbon-like protein
MPHVYIGPDTTEEDEAIVLSTMLEELLMAHLRKALDNLEFAERVIKIAEDMEETRLAGALKDLGRPEQGEVRQCACGCGNSFVATSKNQVYCDLGCGNNTEMLPDGSQIIYLGGKSGSEIH